MESVELSARSVEEAVQQALIRLGKDRDEVEVIVLSEGHKGILGFVRGESARVRVTVRRPSSAATPEAERVAPKAAPSPPTSAPPRAEAAPPTSAPPRAEAAPPTSSTPPDETEATPSVAPGMAPRPADSAVVAQDTMEELLEKMVIDADVICRGGTGTDENPILLDVVGDDLGILIGRRGETLASLQFIVNLMVGKRLNTWVRVLIDVEGYRVRREEALRSLATRAAERVRRTGQSVTLEPMPANERRMVHLALQNSPHVTTESSGYGEERRVTVMPRVGVGGRGARG